MNKGFLRIPHRVLEVLSYVFILVGMAYIVFLQIKTDGVIATHFDIHGNPDAYGSPMEYIVLPIILLIVNALMSLMLHFYPVDKWNMPCRVNANAAAKVFDDAIWLMVLLMFLFGVFSLTGCLVLTSKTSFFGIGIAWMALIFLLPIFFIVKIIKDNKKYA